MEQFSKGLRRSKGDVAVLSMLHNELRPLYSFRHGNVGSNVLSSHSFYQKTGKISDVAVGTYNGTTFTQVGEPQRWGNELMEIGNVLLKGWPTGGATIDVRIDTDPATAEVERIQRYLFPGSSASWGKLKGKDVNHGTIVWWVYEDAKKLFK